MPDLNPPDEFLELVVRSFESALTPEETRRLNEMLRQDASCRERYVQYCLHAQLIRKACAADSASGASAPPTPQTTRRRRVTGGSGSGPWQLALTAAGILVGLVVLLVLVSSPTEERVATRPVRPPVRTPAPIEPRPVVEDVKKPEPPPAPPAPKDEKKPPMSAEELRREKERIDRELREATRVVQKPTPAPEPDKPRPVVEPKQDKPEIKTRVAVAQLEEASDVFFVTKEGKTPANAGDPVLAGQAIHVGTGRAVIRFGDKTRVDLDADTVIDEVKTDGGKWLFVARGRVFAQVTKQIQPMIFATPYGEAKVLGTTLRLIVDREKGLTRLEVEEGKVQLKNLAGKTVDVVSGHFAVAVAGTELTMRPLPINDILLVPSLGKRFGEEWRIVKDDQSASGSAWEAITLPARLPAKDLMNEYNNAEARARNRTAAYVELRFTADADREYTIWVRGSCLASGNPGFDQPLFHYDQVLIELPTGQINRPLRSNPNFYLVNGHAVRPGYWWVGGDAWTSQTNNPPANPEDTQPTSVRFSRSGPQVLRLYAAATVQRIDAIWLSTTQKTRPDDKSTGPVTAPK